MLALIILGGLCAYLVVGAFTCGLLDALNFAGDTATLSGVLWPVTICALILWLIFSVAVFAGTWIGEKLTT